MAEENLHTHKRDLCSAARRLTSEQELHLHSNQRLNLNKDLCRVPLKACTERNPENYRYSPHCFSYRIDCPIINSGPCSERDSQTFAGSVKPL